MDVETFSLLALLAFVFLGRAGVLKCNYSTVISKLCGASIFIGLSNLGHRYDAGFVLSLGGRIFTQFTQTEIAFIYLKNILFYFFNDL